MSSLSPASARGLCAALLSVLLLAGCAAPPAGGPARSETAYILTAGGELLRIATARPDEVISKFKINGLQKNERLLGIDFRPADGRLYGLGSDSRLYRIDTASGEAIAVGGRFAVALAGSEFGFDFNPVVDRIRVVSDSGQNLRLHPDTGAVVDADGKLDGVQTDGTLAYAAGDDNAGRKPRIVAAAYTNNVAGAKATTNFAIDAALGLLVTQGTAEDASPAIPPASPNTGRLYTVGALQAPTGGAVAFDIAPRGNAAFAALAPPRGPSVLYTVDLRSGAARALGRIAGGETVVGLAIAP